MSQILENYDDELRKEGEKKALLKILKTHLERSKSEDFIIEAMVITKDELNDLKKELNNGN